jgi:hypothetical protein
MEDILKEMKKTRALKVFQDLRNAEKYKEEIFDKEKLSDLLKEPEGLIWYKCGKRYFNDAIRAINAVADIVNAATRGEGEEFKSFINSLDEKIQKGEDINPDDIKKANAFLDHVIAELKR